MAKSNSCQQLNNNRGNTSININQDSINKSIINNVNSLSVNNDFFKFKHS